MVLCPIIGLRSEIASITLFWILLKPILLCLLSKPFTRHVWSILKGQGAETLLHLENWSVNCFEPALSTNVYQIDVSMCTKIWPKSCFHYDLLTRLWRKANYCSQMFLKAAVIYQTKQNSKSCPWPNWMKQFIIILIFRGLLIVPVM